MSKNNNLILKNNPFDMIVKTKGIILHQIKYTDSGIVVQTYTREYGRLSFLVKGLRNKKSGKHASLFQSLFIHDMVFYYKPSRSMQVLKEFSVSYSPSDIYMNIKKSCIAVFLGEVMNSILREESPHPQLYDFIDSSIRYFDACSTGYANFHIAFLIGLTSYLGFEPGKRIDPENCYFDMLNGTFVSIPPLHSDCADPEISDILSAFFNTSYELMDSIRLSGELRNKVLDTIIRYYSVHLPGLKKINSLDIMKEIFR